MWSRVNNRGQFHLLELGIGLVLLLGLMQAMPAQEGESIHSLNEKIRLCHDLAGVWTYNAGDIEELFPVMGIENEIIIEEIPQNENFDLNSSANTYSCAAARIRMGFVERIRIRIR